MRLRDLYIFWLPLLASWLLLTAEGPLITAVVNRLPNEVLMLAAIGIVISIAVTIESPIIEILATATALVRDRQSFLMMRRFAMHWMVGLTVIHALFTFTPLYTWLLRDVLGAPDDVRMAARPGLAILTFWSAAIAWRRFLQGVMIRFGQTRRIAKGTMIRLCSTASCVLGLALWTELSGVEIGSSGLLAGVVAEAIYVSFAVRPLLRGELGPDAAPEPGPDLSYGELFRFHLPLAVTSMLTLLSQPLITAALLRMPDPRVSLAAWPIIFQIMLLMRAIAFAVPEVVISQTDGTVERFRLLRRFALSAVALSFLLMLTLCVTPGLSLYLGKLQSAANEIREPARQAILLLLPLPALATLIAWLRGLLIHARATRAVNAAMLMRLGVTLTALSTGVMIQAPGLMTAAVSMNLSAVAEGLFLASRARATLGFAPWARSPRLPEGAVRGEDTSSA